MAFRPVALNPDLLEHVLSFLHVPNKGLARDEDRRPAWMGMRLDEDWWRCRTLAKMLAVGHKRLFLAHGFQDSWGSQIRRHLKVTSFRHAASNLHHLPQGERENVIEDEEYEPCRSLRPNPHIGETWDDMPVGLDHAVMKRTMKCIIEEFLDRVGLSMAHVIETEDSYDFCQPHREMTYKDDDGDTITDVYFDVAISWDIGDWVATVRTEDGDFDLDSITALKPHMDCKRLYSYQEALAVPEMATACKEMHRFKLTALLLNDPIHIQIKFRNGQRSSIPDAVYWGITSAGLVHRTEDASPSNVTETLWQDVLRITRRNV